MINKLKETNHFMKRLWSRGFYLTNIEKLIQKLEPQKQKTIFIYSSKCLKKLNIQIDRNSYLVIIVKKNVLLTIFTIDDLYGYIKCNLSTNFKIINSI